jgi:hypothetical protein
MHHHLQRGKDTAALAALPEGFFAREKKNRTTDRATLLL